VSAAQGSVRSSTRVRVHVAASDPATRERFLALARSCGYASVAEPDGSADTVVVAAARTVDEAIEQCPAPYRIRGGWLLIAETFTTSETLRAVRAGAHAMLWSANANPERFATAVDTARRGEGLMPSEVLVRLLGGTAATGPRASAQVQAQVSVRSAVSTAPRSPKRPAPRSPLTGRQLTVLALVAEGHDNAAIARELDCSQHTVRNVIYNLTSRLQVRNRAQAVACAVRTGLI
jgi:DNA-binding NarL/FixJ family response regulator